jgi:hypothetical protein
LVLNSSLCLRRRRRPLSSSTVFTCPPRTQVDTIILAGAGPREDDFAGRLRNIYWPVD